MAAASKDALVLCLDVGIGMQHAAPGQASALERSINILSLLIQRKIFAQSKDEVALVLFGCDETNNQLAASDDNSYSNISVIYPLGMADFDVLQYSMDGIKQGTAEIDFLDALTVCLDIFFNETRNRKFNCRRIVLFTNFNHPSCDDGLDGIIAGFSACDMDVQLNIIGSHIETVDEAVKMGACSDSFSSDEPGPSTSKRRKLDNEEQHGRIDECTKKPITAQQMSGEKTIKHMLASGVGGACYSFSHACEAVSGFEKMSVRSAAWKCNLTLGNELSIPCVAYAKTKEAKLKQSWKKCHAKSHKAQDVMLNQYFHIDDSDQTEVSKSNVGKGYKYGKDIIPFGVEDEKMMKYLTDGKCLNILGFTDVENAPPSLHMDDQAHFVIPETGDKDAASALQSLILAMQRQALCAIACYVYRRGSNPKLVALLPRVKDDRMCLVMVSLPFSEDVRPLSFQSPSASDQLSPDQLDSIDQLITNMDLSDTLDEPFNPRNLLNPFFQSTFHSLHHRAFHPRVDLPEPPDLIARSLSPHPEVVLRSSTALNKVRQAFELERATPQATPVNRWKDFEIKEANLPSNKDASGYTYQPLATITAPSIEHVGTITPDSDFIAILSNNHQNDEKVKAAFGELKARIEAFILDPFASQLTNKIIVSIKALTSRADQHQQVENVDRFLIAIKKALLKNNTQLWKMLLQNDINLIGCGDYDGTNKSNYHCDDKKPAAVDIYDDATEQEAEDLLEMID